MPAPQWPHLSRPVSSVGEVTRRGGTLAGARAARRHCAPSKVPLSIIGSTATRTHSVSAFGSPVLLLFRLKTYSPQ